MKARRAWREERAERRDAPERHRQAPITARKPSPSVISRSVISSHLISSHRTTPPLLALRLPQPLTTPTPTNQPTQPTHPTPSTSSTQAKANARKTTKPGIARSPRPHHPPRLAAGELAALDPAAPGPAA
ncbi:uncharacterized protein THITE_127646, partial [Thermothielavioides terrestris NRRL 8126]